MTSLRKVSLREAALKIDGFWNPMILGELNSQYLKMAKFKGEFDWHYHENEDECFLVTKGAIQIHLRDGVIDLGEGELVVIPRGVEHKPVAVDEAHVLLFEPQTTLNTGSVQTEKTKTDLNHYEG